MLSFIKFVRSLQWRALCYGQAPSTSLECVGGIWVLSVFKPDITSLNKQPQYWSVWSNFTENEASQKSDEQF